MWVEESHLLVAPVVYKNPIHILSDLENERVYILGDRFVTLLSD